MNYLNQELDQKELAISFVFDHPRKFSVGDYIAVDPFGHCTIDTSKDNRPLSSYLEGTILFPAYLLKWEIEDAIEDELYYSKTA